MIQTAEFEKNVGIMEEDLKTSNESKRKNNLEIVFSLILFTSTIVCLWKASSLAISLVVNM
jgi:hypothetical protein